MFGIRKLITSFEMDFRDVKDYYFKGKYENANDLLVNQKIIHMSANIKLWVVKMLVPADKYVKNANHISGMEDIKKAI